MMKKMKIDHNPSLLQKTFQPF